MTLTPELDRSKKLVTLARGMSWIIVLFLLGAVNSVAAQEADRPNVLIIVLDAARPDHFGSYGYKRPTTPEIDLICKKSLVFTNAFTVAPYTVAATASLFTSLYPETHGVVDPENRLSEKIPTMAESFLKAGYRTILVGNNPFFSRTFGMDRGFNVYIEETSYQTDRAEIVTKRVVDELQRTKGAFFCYVHYLRPHDPYGAADEIRSLFNRADKPVNYDLGGMDQGTVSITPERQAAVIDDYDAGLRTVDREVGKLLQYLRSARQLDDTIVVILSDHGEAFGEHGKMLHSSTVYEEMIRIPLVLYYPKKVKAAKNDSLAQTVDVFPTIAQLAAVPLPEFVQGQSLLGKKPKYAFSRTNGYTPLFAVRTAEAKMIRDSQGKTVEFYDLTKDPLEKEGLARNRVSGRDAARLHELESVFARWLGFCLSKNQGRITVKNMDRELLERLRSLGYIQ